MKKTILALLATLTFGLASAQAAEDPITVFARAFQDTEPTQRTVTPAEQDPLILAVTRAFWRVSGDDRDPQADPANTAFWSRQAGTTPALLVMTPQGHGRMGL
ncbi:MAG: hypothetical protein HQM03_20465 [Magnetococcales bacterium]|nr:hypothetical protein [Magnetococcales bacterium]